MKKSYIICNRKITVEAPWFTPQEGYWPMFEAEFHEADINVLCRECENLPDFGGKRLGECGDVTVSIDGGKDKGARLCRYLQHLYRHRDHDRL